MIWGYFDESGEFRDKTLVNMTVGGVFAPLETWNEFNRKWKKVLDDEALTWFHMTDFERWKNEFDFRLPNGERESSIINL